MTSEEIEAFKTELINAINSGKYIDYGFDGEDEYAFDAYETRWAFENIITLLKKWGLIPHTTDLQPPII